ncbi:hypothetical protein [Paenibacillus alkalitolerans]|uniref:hypothetical protein n=1 Tax=Paenibacillus alkalitolerans TaxID=2799335 RepID=UPI0018F563D2|nr:hypothetical protein [Paenibacillus alkalitolerans]
MKVHWTPVLNMPFSAIHNVFSHQGFRRIRFKQHSAYRTRFEDASTKKSYCFMIPVQDDDDSNCSVRIADAFFQHSGSVPREVVHAAESILSEVNEYLQDEKEKQDRQKLEETRQNGGMSPNMKEMIRLGKEMAAMKTNKELLEAGQIPDPTQ